MVSSHFTVGNNRVTKVSGKATMNNNWFNNHGLPIMAVKNNPNGSWSCIPRARSELIDRFPGSNRRPYYVHTPSGYTQFEYPTTMTAWENGLYSQSNSSQPMYPRQMGQCSGSSEFRASGQYYPPSPNGFGSQRSNGHRYGNESWGGSGNQGYY